MLWLAVKNWGPLTMHSRSGPSRSGLSLLFAGLLAAGLLSLAAVRTDATTLYVDANNHSCSDSDPGTSDQPFCTISKAGSLAVAGQTVQVAAGTLCRERCARPLRRGWLSDRLYPPHPARSSLLPGNQPALMALPFPARATSLSGISLSPGRSGTESPPF